MDFTKRDTRAPEGFFDAEAAGLRWLGEAHGARVVTVRDVGPHHITLERLQTHPPTVSEAEEFGRALAQTHAAGADAWGAPPPGSGDGGFIGPLPQANLPCARWGVFYAHHRVRPFLEQAVERGAVDSAGRQVIERVCERLENGDFDDDSAPARIHGDLWSGNVITTPGRWTMIDPSAHGGHRITDLAMLSLFGNAHLGATFAAYAEAAALEPNWRALIPLHQLHPLLVHAVLFRAGYGASAVAAAEAYA
ncbi:fructosamine kinase family protein [Ammonicoccus fulvus]|uniref:Fructosamine kinase family protein n=1 Tax=Ammonicoccus fulvus TaxID=3138240 RepID=A0ABZ3FJB0_9ACTN